MFFIQGLVPVEKNSQEATSNGKGFPILEAGVATKNLPNGNTQESLEDKWKSYNKFQVNFWVSEAASDVVLK